MRQYECAEHHQARDDDIRSGPKKKRLVDAEPTDLTGFEVGPEVCAVKGEEIDVAKTNSIDTHSAEILVLTFTVAGSNFVSETGMRTSCLAASDGHPKRPEPPKLLWTLIRAAPTGSYVREGLKPVWLVRDRVRRPRRRPRRGLLLAALT
jgi:hypothetical protein